MAEFKPYINEIPDIPDILNSEFNVSESKYSNLPLLSLGFHSYTNQVREKMNDSQLKERLFYLVVNQFEHKINDYDKDLESISSNYLKTLNDESISRSFYKIWELIFYFNLISIDSKSFTSSHLADDGSFLQAVIQFRNKFSQDTKKDSYCLIGSKNNSKTEEVISECVNKWKSSINNLKADSLSDEINNTGKLTDIKVLKNYINMVNKENKEVDFITSNGDLGDSNEENLYKLLFAEIVATISIQKNGGSSVFRIFDTYTNVTIKYICLLKALYEKVYICKPLTSRNFKSEKFLVCKNFKFSKGEKLNNITSKLMSILEKMNEINNKNNYIFDIFSEYSFDSNLSKNIVDSNLHLSNNQHLAINRIIEYKNSGNYFGEAYHKYREKQIIANNWWVETFYPEKNNLKSYQKKIKSVIT